MNEINPYQTPVTESIEPQPRGALQLPSSRLVLGCVLLLWGSSTAVWFALGYFTQRSFLTTAAWFAAGPLLCGWILGMGMAVLIQAIVRGQFSDLMPGHWRLIAFSFSMLGQVLVVVLLLVRKVLPISDPAALQLILMYGSEALFGAFFYVVVLQTTHETKAWRWYAFLCVIHYALIIPMTLFVSLIGMPTLSQYPLSYSVMVLVSYLVYFTTIVLLIIAAVKDYQQKIPRDIYHTLGIYLPVGAYVLLSALWIAL